MSYSSMVRRRALLTRFLFASLSCVVRTENYRGMSHLNVKDGDPDSSRAWKTTNQVFSECTAVKNTVGLANMGIASDVAIATHKKQGIYGA